MLDGGPAESLIQLGGDKDPEAGGVRLPIEHERSCVHRGQLVSGRWYDDDNAAPGSDRDVLVGGLLTACEAAIVAGPSGQGTRRALQPAGSR